ncbi:MAG: SDR family oxidoreductase [Patescibacteria group bacterium]
MAYEYIGKWALVTGAGRPGRIGAAIAMELASKGANILLQHRAGGEADAELVRKDVEAAGAEFGVKVVLVAADLTEKADLHTLFGAHAPSIVVHNAAVFEPARVAEGATPEEELDAHELAFDLNMDINMKAVYLTTIRAIRALKDRGMTGTFVFIGDAFISNGGIYDENLGGYVLSKAGAEYLAQFFAANFGKLGFRFNVVLNGPIEPPPSAPKDTVDKIKKEINVPEEKLDPWIGAKAVAETVVSVIGSEHINGATIPVDGARRWKTAKEH